MPLQQGTELATRLDLHGCAKGGADHFVFSLLLECRIHHLAHIEQPLPLLDEWRVHVGVHAREIRQVDRRFTRARHAPPEIVGRDRKYRGKQTSEPVTHQIHDRLGRPALV
jgi:hypothetical protein